MAAQGNPDAAILVLHSEVSAIIQHTLQQALDTISGIVYKYD